MKTLIEKIATELVESRIIEDVRDLIDVDYRVELNRNFRSFGHYMFTVTFKINDEELTYTEGFDQAYIFDAIKYNEDKEQIIAMIESATDIYNLVYQDLQ